MGDELDEWILSAIDHLRKAVLTGLGWLEEGLEVRACVRVPAGVRWSSPPS
jgi:hypothetical protein